MSEDFYDVLGVSRDASEDEINRAFRKKAAKYHPDVSDEPDAEEKFKQAKKAKEVLTDEQQRAAYDRMGHERFEQAEKRGGFDGGGAGAGGFGGTGGFGGGGGLGDIFEQFFSGGGGGGRRQGADLQTRLTVTLEEVYEGVEKQMTIERPEECPSCDGQGGTNPRTCPECNGRGQVTQVQQTPFGRMQQTRTCGRCRGDGQVYEESCTECRGDGQITREATLTVEIPRGIRDGQTLRMEREGAPGERGGPNGDLLIEIALEEHPDFERDGDDLKYRKAISFPQAVFGDTVEIPTMEGSVQMDVPAGTQSGERFRLEGKGMPRLRRRGHGDLYVSVQVVTPEELNAEQREALEAFAEAGGEEIEVEQGFFERIKSSL
ncbi:MAG: molecular chaperone DnaJ [Halalkalicoccus sp.]